MSDHPDTDLTDPHGEAEALRRENARLRAERDYDRSQSAHKSTVIDRLNARAEAAEAALAELRTATRTYSSGSASVAVCPICDIAGCHHLRAVNRVAASRAPDRVVNAGSGQPGDLISRARAQERIATLIDAAKDAGLNERREGLRDASDAIRALPAAPVAEAQSVASIGGAELDALVARLRKLARDMEKDATDDWDEHEDVAAAAAAITALRARPDWKGDGRAAGGRAG